MAAEHLFDENESNGICSAIYHTCNIDMYCGMKYTVFMHYPELLLISDPNINTDTDYWFDGSDAEVDNEKRNLRGIAILFASELAKDTNN